MRVGWLQDESQYVGGAELTAEEFRKAAPAEVEVIDNRPGDVEPDCDRYVIQNCVTYRLEDLWPLEDKPVFKYWHDVGPHVLSDVKLWLGGNATHICCSPLQASHMGLTDAQTVPPALDLTPFRRAAENAGERRGSVTVGAWMNWGKSPERCREVAPDVDFYGGGPCAPAGSVPVDYEDLPQVLARYRTFIHLPSVLEPFGRAVVEAWAAGLQVVTNALVGARHYIEKEPDKLDTAASDFWNTVLA